jgi:high-affinity Fe2+/Pb2+ permease
MNPEKIIQYALAALLIIGLFVLLGILVYHPIPSDNKEAVNVVLGALAGSVITVVAYYFGSSSGSAAKEKIISEIINKDVTTN